MGREEPPTIAALLAAARRRFRAAGLETPDIDARRLLLESFGISLTDLLLKGEGAADEALRLEFEARVERRLAGEPVHRILGRREFYGLDLRLSPDTLEPRPDTEILVDALRNAAAMAISRSGACRILDLGAGTGAIGLALLSLHKEARAVGADLSRDAVRTAAGNAARLGLEPRYEAVVSDWYREIEGAFDIVVSNPPYIPTGDIESLALEVRIGDPRRALDGGEDGLHAYRAIAAGWRDHLAEDGVLGLEIGHNQREAVTRLFEATGLECVEARADLAGRDRVLVFRRAAPGSTGTKSPE